MVRADRPCSPSRRYFPCRLTADDRRRHPSPFSPCPVLRRNPHGYIIIIPLPYVKRPAPGQPALGRPLPPLHTKCPLRRSSIAGTGDRFNPFPHRSGKPLPRRPDRAQTSPVRRPPRAGQYSSLRERPCPPAWMSRSPRRFRPVLPLEPSLPAASSAHSLASCKHLIIISLISSCVFRLIYTFFFGEIQRIFMCIAVIC